MNTTNVSEELLHQIWKYRLFQQKGLITKCSEELEIISTGNHNSDAGPDFHAAKIKIGSTVWVGNIEIHIRNSDWNKHGHDRDKAYDSIILHVVYIDDLPNQKSPNIHPVLELRSYIQKNIIDNYRNLMECRDWIPCQKNWHEVPKITKMNFIERLAIERMEAKSKLIGELLATNGNNWEIALYCQLGKYFGAPINSIPFELLTKKVPYLFVLKNRDSLNKIESLLFGTAGFLEENLSDPYMHYLQKNYCVFKKKYQIEPLQKHLWKFLRMRPGSFPTIKIAQFAMLYFQSEHLFSQVIEMADLNEMKNLFRVRTSHYWENHYIPEKASSFQIKNMGTAFIDSLLINAILPILFAYAQKNGNQKLLNRSMGFLEEIEGEKNNCIRKFEDLNITAQSALHSQGILQLKKEFCEQQKCLQCSIGIQLLKK